MHTLWYSSTLTAFLARGSTTTWIKIMLTWGPGDQFSKEFISEYKKLFVFLPVATLTPDKRRYVWLSRTRQRTCEQHLSV